jgi:asparagine synthase (glutamine-hydrolysing)
VRGAAGRLLALAPPTSLAGRRLRRIGQLLALPEDTMLVEAMCFSEVAAEGRARLLAPELRGKFAGHVPQAVRCSLEATRGRHPVERMIDLELNAFLPDHNLNYIDKMAMQAGVEVRVPLVDPRLLAFAQRLPVSDRIGLFHTKRILRRSQKGRIPDSVLARPKQGFGVPMRAWLRGPARGMMEELTGERAIASRGLFDARAAGELRRRFLDGRIDAAMTLFPMMALELWCRALESWRPAEPPLAQAGAAHQVSR